MIEIKRYNFRATKTYRFVFRYNEEWRPLLWVNIGADGSIYLGPSIKHPSWFKRDFKHVTSNKLDVIYADGSETDDPPESQKLSFHASGLTKLGDGRAWSGSLRDLKRSRQLVTVCFAHPGTFESVGKTRRNDFLLSYPFDESAPLVAGLYVHMMDGISKPKLPNARHTTNIWFSAIGREAVVCQLVFWHGPRGPWPPGTWLVSGGLYRPQRSDGS